MGQGIQRHKYFISNKGEVSNCSGNDIRKLHPNNQIPTAAVHGSGAHSTEQFLGI